MAEVHALNDFHYSTAMERGMGAAVRAMAQGPARAAVQGPEQGGWTPPTVDGWFRRRPGRQLKNGKKDNPRFFFGFS